MTTVYSIEILDSSLNVVAKVLDPVPLNSQGHILQFSKELSNFGQCSFRVSAYDNMLTQYGDVFLPHVNHVRLRRNGVIVWSGCIIDNSKRNAEYWEITAAEYEFYLSKILVTRSSVDPGVGTGGPNGGLDGIFRIFNSGTMAAAVTTIINETIARFNTSTNAASPLAGMTIGTIDNPNYPPNMTDNTSAALTGAWNFTTNLQLSFDFQSILYVLSQMGIYAYADFEVDENLKFSFLKFLGNNKSYSTNFVFNQTADSAQSNIVDYNLPRLGQRQVNDLWGIATDTNGTIWNKEKPDQSSITRYGFMEGVAAYSDVKDPGILDARTAAELPLVSTPDETNVIVILNETSAYPLGTWDIGDIVNINIQNKAVDFRDTRRVVGVTVQVHSTGRETTTVQTNKPLPWQYGIAGSAQ
jgi:hypothetical protein